MLRPLLLLTLTALPGYLAAQTAPAIRLQAASMPLPATANPVDVAVINYSPTMSPLIVTVAQGDNTLYPARVGPRPQTFVQYGGTIPLAAAPLSVLPMRYQNRVAGRPEGVVVLTADGNVTPMSTTPGSLQISFTRAPFALRNGLACASTDRLVAGHYQTDPAAYSLVPDLGCWSNGPQPGFARAQNLGQGVFQALPAVPTAAGVTARTMLTANLVNDPSGLEDAVLSLTGAPNSNVYTCLNARQAGSTASWSTDPTPLTFGYLPNRNQALTTTPSGACQGLAVGDINADGIVDLVGGNPGQVVVRYGTLYLNAAQANYGLRTPPELVPLFNAPRELLLADLTGDNKPELLVLSNGLLSVFLNTAITGNYRQPPFEPTPYVFSTGLDPALIRVADIDADGDLDVLVPNRGDHTVSVFWNGRIALGTAAAAAPVAPLGVYPNPAAATLHLRWAGAAGTRSATATLLDLTGREVHRWPAEASGTTLDVADVPRGVYVLRLGTGATRRVVLQ